MLDGARRVGKGGGEGLPLSGVTVWRARSLISSAPSSVRTPSAMSARLRRVIGPLSLGHQLGLRPVLALGVGGGMQ